MTPKKLSPLQLPKASDHAVRNALIPLATLLVIICIAMVALSGIKYQIRHGIEDQLAATLNLTHAIVTNWHDSRNNEMETLVARPDVLACIRKLLKIYESGSSLPESEALGELQGILAPWLDNHHAHGFFVFAPDGVSIASTRDQNIGILTPVATLGDYLEKTFKGRHTLVHPYPSKVELPDATGRLRTGVSTMFLTSPVIDEAGTIIAAFAIRLDPRDHFSGLIMLAHTGNSGDAYAFNSEGQAITEVRFVKEARDLGLIPEYMGSPLNLEIRDPGGDLTLGFRPEQPREKRPLTKMAERAIAGKDGIDVTGYRDYRGVPVVGAWLWNEQLRFGLTFELDVTEAYAPYVSIRRIVMGVLFVITMFSAVIVLTVETRRRAAVATQRFIASSEKKITTLTNNVSDAIIMIDDNDRIQFWNNGAEEMFGVPRDQALGALLHETVIPHHTREEAHQGLKRYWETGEGPILNNLRELTAITHEGREFPVELSIRPLIMDDKRWAVGVVRDISERKRVEQEFTRLRHRLTLATSAAGIGIWDWNITDNTLLWDESMYRMYQVSPGDFSSDYEAWRKTLHPEDIDRVEKNLKEAVAGNKTFSPTFRLILPDGSIRHIKANAILYRDETGRVDRMVGTNTDITELVESQNDLKRLNIELENRVKKRTHELETTKNKAVDLMEESTRQRDLAENTMAELFQSRQALETSEERFREIVENTQDIIWELGPEGDITYTSPSIEGSIGFSPDELLGRNVREVVAPDDIPKVEEILLGSWAPGTAVKGFEYAQPHKEGGRPISFEANFQPYFTKPGELAGFRGISRDVTERKVAHATVRKLSEAVEASPMSVLITDREGIIEYVNPQFTEISGYSKEDALGQTPRILKSGLMTSDFYREIWHTIRNGDRWNGEIVNRKKDGTLFWENVSISPITSGNGKITHFVAVKEDITARKDAEKLIQEALKHAEKANRAKSDFLANMSHEIRTPMNAVIGLTHLALSTDLPPKQRDYLDKIRSSADSLLTIINDILDFSKIEADRLEIEATPFSFQETLEEVATLSAETVYKKEIELLLDISPDIPDRLIGDPVRISQVFTNLLSNAAKFTEKGFIRIAARPTSLSDERAIIECTVEDTGIGMTQEQVDKLFQKFSQADTSTTRKYGGTGLGLAICKSLVELMGGTIRATSAPGKGSAFTFTLFLGVKEATQHSKAHLPLNLRNLNVLLFAQNEVALEHMKNMLQHLTFTVIPVNSCRKAIRALKDAKSARQPVELLVIDWQAIKERPTAIEKAMLHNESLAGIPVLVKASPGNVERAEHLIENRTMASLLVKPATPSRLFDAVVDAFGYGDLKIKAKPTDPFALPGNIASIGGAHILLVEDNAINQQVAVELLSKAGVSVSVARNGKKALEKVQSEAFDLVFMDIQMPVMDGLEAARAIRRWEASKDKDTPSRLPIIAMTANAMAGDQEKSIGAGMDDHINKPISPKSLYESLLRWLPHTDLPAGPLPKAAAQTDDEATLPQAFTRELSGMDHQTALARMGGNSTLFIQVLQDFLEENSDILETLHTDLANDNTWQAILRAHTLKGTAATLSATSVKEAAEKLELALEASDTTAPQHLEALATCLPPLLSGIRNALDAVQQEPAESPTLAETLSPDELAPTLTRLSELLHINDMMAQDLFNEVRPHLAAPLPNETAQLETQLQAFRFKEARGTLHAMCETLSIPLNQGETP